MPEALHSMMTFGLGNYDRPEEHLMMTFGFPVKSDQRIVIYGDSKITTSIEDTSRITTESIEGESKITKIIEDVSCITTEIIGDSKITKFVEGDSVIPVINLYP